MASSAHWFYLASWAVEAPRANASEAKGAEAPARRLRERQDQGAALDRPRGAAYISLLREASLFQTAPQGPVAEWLGRGLQSLVRRFDSGPGLHPPIWALIYHSFLPFVVPPAELGRSAGGGASCVRRDRRLIRAGAAAAGAAKDLQATRGLVITRGLSCRRHRPGRIGH